MKQADQSFFSKTVTDGESWCFEYDQETKRKWIGKGSPRGEKKNSASDEGRQCSSSSMTQRESFTKNLHHRGTTVNPVFYKVVMDRLLPRIGHVRTEMKTSGD